MNGGKHVGKESDEVRVERCDRMEMLVVERDWIGETESGRWMIELEIWRRLIGMGE